MATYRLLDGLSGRPGNGPDSGISFSSPFIAGMVWQVTQGGMWFEGYDWWVCPSAPAGSTAPQKFALWCLTGTQAGSVIPAATFTSGTLAPGRNFVSLPTPIQIAPGTAYVVDTGFTGNFPDTQNQFGASMPYAAGIVNGPLTAYSDGSAGGTGPTAPYGMSQGVFSTAGSDPAQVLPLQASSSSNFWIGPVVSDTAPPGYSGSYSLWPNNLAGDAATALDSAVNYALGTEVILSVPCALNAVRHLSFTGAGQLPTECGVWNTVSHTRVALDATPSWSGAAGSGFIECGFTGVILPPGRYKPYTWNGAGTPQPWSAKRLNYWDTGPGANGITNGPVSAPGLAAASTAYVYDGSQPGSTPPYTTGATGPGQSTFAQGTDLEPYLYVTGLAQNYWVDMRVTPLAPSGLLVACFP